MSLLVHGSERLIFVFDDFGNQLQQFLARFGEDFLAGGGGAVVYASPAIDDRVPA